MQWNACGAVHLRGLWSSYLTYTVIVIEYYSTFDYKEGNEP